jgi:hypothetical protein
MRAMSFLHRRADQHTPYSSPFCRHTTYCNQDVHIGVEVGGQGGSVCMIGAFWDNAANVGEQTDWGGVGCMLEGG